MVYGGFSQTPWGSSPAVAVFFSLFSFLSQQAGFQLNVRNIIILVSSYSLVFLIMHHMQLQHNLNEKVLPENKVEAKVNWSYVGLGGHSGGGGVALDMIMNDTSMAKVKRVIGNQCLVND